MNELLLDDTPLDSNSTIGSEVEWIDRIFSNTSLGHRLLHRLTITNLRHVFYGISPYETIVPDIEFVPNYNIEVSTWWFVLITIEFVVLAIGGKHSRFALNDSITSVCAGMLSQCFKFGGRAVAIFGYVWVWNNLRVIEMPWDNYWTWILCLFTQDFMYYLGHRAVHEMGFFWGLHTIHHSSEYYNLSTALRQAAIQDAGLALYDILQAFLIPPPIFLVHRYFSEIFQFVMHTSLVGDLWYLGFIFNTPSHHRVHHGRNPYCIDKNYGGVFIIWDRIFQTFEAERHDDPPIYGLVTNENSFNQIWLQFHVLWELAFLKGMAKDKKGEPVFPGVLNKFRAAFYPPGWAPGVPVVPFFHWMSMKDPTYNVPQPEVPVVKYNPHLPLATKSYVFFHFLLLLAVFFHFEYDRNHLTYADFSCKIAFFLLSLQCFGAFFDKRWFAPYLEISRCFSVIGFYAVLVFDRIGPGAHRLFMMAVYTISAVIWIIFLIVMEIKARQVTIKPSNPKENTVQINVISVKCEGS